MSAVQFPEDVEREDDRRGEVVCEEVLGGDAGGCAADGLLYLLLAFFSSLTPKVWGERRRKLKGKGNSQQQQYKT